MSNNQNIYALDLGIASCGWAAQIKKMNEIEFGVRTFDEAESTESRRNHRQGKRRKERTKWKKHQFKQALVEHGLVTQKEAKDRKYFLFKNVDPKYEPINDLSIYHLQFRGLNEKLTMRELVLCLYHYINHRGHFYTEHIDYSHGNVPYDTFFSMFRTWIEPYLSTNVDFQSISNTILKNIYIGVLTKQAEVKDVMDESLILDKQDREILFEAFKFLLGNVTNLKKFNEDWMIDDSYKIKAEKVIEMTNPIPFLSEGYVLYSILKVSCLLQEFHTPCERNMHALDNLLALRNQKARLESLVQKDHKDDAALQEQLASCNLKLQQYKENMSSKVLDPNKIKAVHNLSNVFPCGIYRFEMMKLLNHQKQYHPEITDDFIRLCCDIHSNHLRYDVGPISEYAPFRWAKVNREEKWMYSYRYSQERYSIVDELETSKSWKKFIGGKCRYFPTESCLAKGSFIGEMMNILNEINVLEAIDPSGNIYPLSQRDKINLFDSLYLQKKKVSCKQITKLLSLQSFGSRAEGTDHKLNQSFTLYHDVVHWMPSLRLDSITEVFTNPNKINHLEKVLYHLNIIDDIYVKESFFRDIENITNEQAIKSLSRLNSKGFFSVSKKIITDTSINILGQSVLEKLFDDNNLNESNDFQSIIAKATDEKGKPLNLSSNIYINQLKKNGGKLDISLLIDDGIPLVPMSRTTARSVDEAFKIIASLEKLYGVPSEIVIETSKELSMSKKDREKERRKKPKSHLELLKDLYKKAKNANNNALEDWETIVSFYNGRTKKKIELYLQQHGVDMLSGEPISLDQLSQYEIDHILPQGFNDDSMTNFMLIHRQYNAKKSNRVPMQFLSEESLHAITSGRLITAASFESRVHKLLSCKTIPKEKAKRLLLKNIDDALGFVSRDLVNTRYITKIVMAALTAYYQYHGKKVKITSINGKYTSIFRNFFGLRKNRNLGCQHHAYDALTILLASRCFQTYLPYYSKEKSKMIYNNFLKNLLKNQLEFGNRYDKQNQVLRKAYFTAFGNYPENYESIVSYAKRCKPLYSCKESHKYTGEFFDQTIYSVNTLKFRAKPPKPNGPQFTLGLYNENRFYSSVQCCAVDFYKVKDKKGNSRWLAVHIPKFIVSQSGIIDSKKYTKLITDYFQFKELIDEQGQLKTHLFRLRIFPNELVYDTTNKEICAFKLGSIVNQTISFASIPCFAYEDIYSVVRDYRAKLSTVFNFYHPSLNPEGTASFAETNINELSQYTLEQLTPFQPTDTKWKYAENILKNSKSLMDFLEKAAFLTMYGSRKTVPASLKGSWVTYPGVFDKDSQFIKIKSTPLGVRCIQNKEGYPIIHGPKHHRNAFKSIRREEFTWNIEKQPIL